MKHKRKPNGTFIRLCVFTSVLTVFLVGCFCILKLTYLSQNAVLQSKWRSEETGQVLTFTEDNKVKLENSKATGIYYIRTPEKMEYTIEGKSFQMIYRIDGNKLYWGLDSENLECFSKI